MAEKKPAAPPFGAAPRPVEAPSAGVLPLRPIEPRPRLTPEQLEEMSRGTSFERPLARGAAPQVAVERQEASPAAAPSAARTDVIPDPEREPEPPAPPSIAPASSAPSRKPRAKQAPRVPQPAAEVAAEAIVKFEVPALVYRKLRVTAAERGVTIKYLMWELLSEAGHDIDMTNVPTDGRRAR